MYENLLMLADVILWIFVNFLLNIFFRIHARLKVLELSGDLNYLTSLVTICSMSKPKSVEVKNPT